MTIRDIPARLLNDEYMDALSSFRMYQHAVDAGSGHDKSEFEKLVPVRADRRVHQINGVSMRAERGHTFLMTPADFHLVAPDPGQTLRLYNLIFTERMISEDLVEQLFERKKAYCHYYGDKEFAEAQREFERILSEAAEWREHSGIVVKGCIERLLVDLSRSCPDTERGPQEEADLPPVHPSVRKALLYLQHHFREPLQLEKVARLAGLSANYFSESFSKQTGSTFQAYVRDLRLQFAKSLLGATTLPITEICYAAGFNTLPYFERAFKARYGMSPRSARGAGAKA